jgi:AraC-like DNA-binding protein
MVAGAYGVGDLVGRLSEASDAGPAAKAESGCPMGRGRARARELSSSSRQFSGPRLAIKWPGSVEACLRTTSTLAINSWLESAAALGVDRELLLQRVGLDAALLADPQGRLPVEIERRLWEEGALASGDPDFGLHLAEAFDKTNIGLLDYLTRFSATVGDAIALLVQYQHLITDGLQLELTRHSSPPRLELFFSPPPTRHLAEGLLAILVLRGRRFGGSDSNPLEVEIPHAAPRDLREHRRIFGVPLRFGRGVSRLVLDPECLARPMLSANPPVADLLGELAQSRNNLRPATLVEQVRAAIARQLPDGEPKLTAVARALHLSPRILQRRLVEASTSFSRLVDETRHQHALELLESAQPLGEIAHRLGFSELSAFHRAFKRWTGRTPGSAR